MKLLLIFLISTMCYAQELWFLEKEYEPVYEYLFYEDDTIMVCEVIDENGIIWGYENPVIIIRRNYYTKNWEVAWDRDRELFKEKE